MIDKNKTHLARQRYSFWAGTIDKFPRDQWLAQKSPDEQSWLLRTWQKLAQSPGKLIKRDKKQS